jgi:hypothetical protein
MTARHLRSVPPQPPAGVWLIARTPTDQPYPCRCSASGRCNPRYCPCAGRLDLDNVSANCCAHHNTSEVAAAAQRTGGRRNTSRGASA